MTKDHYTGVVYAAPTWNVYQRVAGSWVVVQRCKGFQAACSAYDALRAANPDTTYTINFGA